MSYQTKFLFKDVRSALLVIELFGGLDPGFERMSLDKFTPNVTAPTTVLNQYASRREGLVGEWSHKTGGRKGSTDYVEIEVRSMTARFERSQPVTIEHFGAGHDLKVGAILALAQMMEIGLSNLLPQDLSGPKLFAKSVKDLSVISFPYFKVDEFAAHILRIVSHAVQLSSEDQINLAAQLGLKGYKPENTGVVDAVSVRGVRPGVYALNWQEQSGEQLIERKKMVKAACLMDLLADMINDADLAQAVKPSQLDEFDQDWPDGLITRTSKLFAVEDWLVLHFKERTAAPNYTPGTAA